MARFEDAFTVAAGYLIFVLVGSVSMTSNLKADFGLPGCYHFKGRDEGASSCPWIISIQVYLQHCSSYVVLIHGY